jgi:predicted RNA-binding Zn ribbon-like protein
MDSLLGTIGVMSSTIPSRPESIELIGGHSAVDLVNTVSWRRDADRWRENLAVPLDLLTWAHRAAVVDKQHLTAMRLAMVQDPEMADGVLGRVHELREQLHHHLADCIDHPGREQLIEAGSPLHRAFADGVTVGSLAGTPARWTLQARSPHDLPRVLALHALDLVQTMPLDRLRRCDDDGCGWLFLDSTRNHSRRWCSSGDCGNRDRARRHYARNRTTVRADAPLRMGANSPHDDRRLGPRATS